MRRIICCLIAAALLGSPVPATAAEQASTPAPAAPQTLASWVQAEQLLEQLEASVGSLPASDARVSGIVSDLVGWGLSAVGLAVSGDSSAAISQGLSDISQGLAGVQSSLNAISAQLGALSGELQQVSEQEKWADCADQTQSASGPAGVIQAAASDYNQFLTQATSASTSEPAPQVDALVDWASEYTSGNSLVAALDAINLMLMGSSQNGSLQACSAALMGMTQGSALTFEQTYYGSLYQYLSYWYQMQVQGLNLYVEAEHLLALNAAGELSSFSPTQPSIICTQPISGVVTTFCDLAYNQVSAVYDNLVVQMYMAGAPYLWGSGGTMSAPSPQTGNKAWLLDINDFQAGGCSLPLTSITTACGGTVGTTAAFANDRWGPYPGLLYTGWQPAVTSDWLSLISASYQFTGSGYFWQAMIQAGFGDTSWGTGAGLQNLIVYTSEVTASNSQDLMPGFWQSKPGSDFQNLVAGMCLLDTQGALNQYVIPSVLTPVPVWTQPLCDDQNGGMLSVLIDDVDPANSTWSSSAPNGATGSYPRGGPFTPTAFYDAQFSEGPKGMPWWINQVPGWMTQTYGLYGAPNPGWYGYEPTPQYRWPVLPLSDVECTASIPGTGTTMSVKTSSGAYTMCGADMQAWVAAQLPDQPIVAPAGSVSSAPKFGAAKVSWTPSKGQRHVTGYRIRGKRDGGTWTTLQTVPKATSARITVNRPGWWRFKVVTLVRDRKSRPSAPSRAEYVAVSKHRWRFYTFRDGARTRIAKAFSDGRVYFAGRQQQGAGELRKARITGHTYRGANPWSGPWVQRTSGSWKHLRWDGWTRVAGPARTRAGMPLRRAHLQRW